jgi:methylisocitrate lyase
MTTHAGRRLRRLLAEPGIRVSVGVYDCLSAKLAEQNGFELVFTSGFGMAATTLGMPDFGLLTATEMLDRVRHIVRAVDVPVVADLDTGYGNPLNVIRTVREAVEDGVAGILLEDQEWPKKCGHFDGKRVIPTAEHVEKIRAAVHARGDSELVIIGRTDARAEFGLEEAIQRGRAYRAAGADVIFIEAPQAESELEAIARAFPDVPLFANLIEGGKTPRVSVPTLERMGFKLAVFALAGLFSASWALADCFRRIRQEGTSGALQERFSFKDFEALMAVETYRRLEGQFVTAATPKDQP